MSQVYGPNDPRGRAARNASLLAHHTRPAAQPPTLTAGVSTPSTAASPPTVRHSDGTQGVPCPAEARALRQPGRQGAFNGWTGEWWLAAAR